MNPRIIILILLCICCDYAVTAQERITIGFYNVENLYDTIPSMFYDDRDYTPEGRLRWDTEKYNRKIENIGRVIDQMGCDVIGLAEVKNETVLRDLISGLSDDYNYIHITGEDYRGIEQALLFKGDKFVPEYFENIGSGYSRGFLHVRGELWI